MKPARLLLFILLCALLASPSAAQQIRFIPDFSAVPSTDLLRFNGSELVPYQSQLALRLTQAEPSFPAATSTYFKMPQPLQDGFSTYFSFQMHQPTQCCNPGDGFAFIIQNSTATDSTEGASGQGLSAIGAAMGGIGYSGINNSLAVEFDILDNPWDPNSNHIAIQTCGGNLSKFNSPVHEPGTYTIGNNHDVTSCLLSPGAINGNLASPLGPVCNGESCSDGPVHQVVIQYTPPSGNQPGNLMLYLDPQFQPGTHTPILGSIPVLNVPYNLIYSQSNPLGLSPASRGQFYVGFTASEENGGTTTDILGWEFTPFSPTEITQVIPPGGIEADYTFGAHQLAVTYPSGYQNPAEDTMTVLETPWNQQVFYNERLVGTPFANEACIIYLGTGGNCIVYSVTCHDPSGNQITCPQEPADDIAICTRFYMSLPAAQINTDFLEADPIGSNNWCSIWTSYTNNQIDGIVSGKGTGFSDIVATQSPTGPGPKCNDLKSLAALMQEAVAPTKMQPTLPPANGFCPAID